MYQTSFDPFREGWELFRSFAGCGFWGGRRFYTRKERLEQLEKLKERLQQEIAGINELIQELKRKEAN